MSGKMVKRKTKGTKVLKQKSKPPETHLCQQKKQKNVKNLLFDSANSSRPWQQVCAKSGRALLKGTTSFKTVPHRRAWNRKVLTALIGSWNNLSNEVFPILEVENSIGILLSKSFTNRKRLLYSTALFVNRPKYFIPYASTPSPPSLPCPAGAESCLACTSDLLLIVWAGLVQTPCGLGSKSRCFEPKGGGGVTSKLLVNGKPWEIRFP